MSEERALSFGSVAEDYEATRPGWPLEPFAEVLEHFGAPERPDVVDVAAGTGKLTRTLAQLAGTLVAVEPDAALRAVLQRELPAVEVLRRHGRGAPAARRERRRRLRRPGLPLVRPRCRARARSRASCAPAAS